MFVRMMIVVIGLLRLTIWCDSLQLVGDENSLCVQQLLFFALLCLCVCVCARCWFSSDLFCHGRL